MDLRQVAGGLDEQHHVAGRQAYTTDVDEAREVKEA